LLAAIREQRTTKVVNFLVGMRRDPQPGCWSQGLAAGGRDDSRRPGRPPVGAGHIPKPTARDRAGGYRLEAVDGRDFVLTTEALREDLPRPWAGRAPIW